MRHWSAGDFHMPLMRLFAFTLLALPFARAEGSEGDPLSICQAVTRQECAFRDKTLIHFDLAREALSAGYAEKGRFDPDALECFLTAYNWLAFCAHAKTCQDPFSYGTDGRFPIRLPEMKRDIGSGWTESFRFTLDKDPSKAPPNCAYSEALTFGTALIRSPDGTLVATENFAAKGNRAGELIIGFEKKAACRRSDGKAIQRDFIASPRGLLVVDAYGNRQTWGKFVHTDPGTRNPSFTPASATQLTLRWGGGARLDFGADGLPQGSNFLDAKAWSAGCAATLKGGHSTPDVALKRDAVGARLRAAPVDSNTSEDDLR